MKHSDGEVLVRVEGLSKKFCRNLKRSLIYGGSDIMKGFLGMEKSSELRNEEFWAIDNVNFELRRGECLGLIGHNGAGKSTLLKMLNGLIRPDKGRIEMNGKVGALIELGAGFSPYLTGRENVYNNGAVLGFSKEEIDRKFNSIVEFAELQEFIDTPVQNYSSGMKVRLGFAVAAHMEPDILLIDEVLAVGDIGFVLKCFNHMDKLLTNSAIILVSHAMPQVVRMATDLLIMEKGKQQFYGKEIGDGVNLYYSKFGSDIANFEKNDKAELVDVEIRNIGKEVVKINGKVLLDPYEPVEVRVVIRAKINISKSAVCLIFYDREQRSFAEVNNHAESECNVSMDEGKDYVFLASFDSLKFSRGSYSLSIALGENTPGRRETIFRIQSALYFQVDNHHHGWAPIQFLPKWEVRS